MVITNHTRGVEHPGGKRLVYIVDHVDHPWGDSRAL